jgi:sugar phosphate permease
VDAMELVPTTRKMLNTQFAHVEIRSSCGTRVCTYFSDGSERGRRDSQQCICMCTNIHIHIYIHILYTYV